MRRSNTLWIVQLALCLTPLAPIWQPVCQAMTFAWDKNGCKHGNLGECEVLSLHAQDFDRSIAYTQPGGIRCARLYPADIAHCGFGLPDNIYFACREIASDASTLTHHTNQTKGLPTYALKTSG